MKCYTASDFIIKIILHEIEKMRWEDDANCNSYPSSFMENMKSGE